MKTAIKNAVIICGGKGSRMGGEYSYTQKCLLPISGKAILSYIIESLVKNKINNITLLTNHFADDVDNFLKTINIPDLNIYTKRSNSEGTTGALKELNGEIDEPFIYCHGNIIFPYKWISNLLRIYSLKKPTALFAASPISLISTHPHIIGRNNKINQIIFPNGNRIPYKSLCTLELTIFSSKIFNILKIANDSSRLCEIFLDQNILNKYNLMYYEVNGMWIHIEIPNDLKKATSQIEMVLKHDLETEKDYIK